MFGPYPTPTPPSSSGGSKDGTGAGDHDVPYTPLPNLKGISMNAELRRRGLIPAKMYHLRDIFHGYSERMR